MWINTKTKKDITLEKMANLGGKRPTREWADILGIEVKDISNALYSEPELKEKYIVKIRNRSVYKMPIKDIVKSLENSKKKLTCDEMAEVTGYTKEQMRGMITKHPEIKKFYIRKIDLDDDEVIAKFSEHWFGQPRFLSDWAVLTNLDTSTIRRKESLLINYFGGDVIIEKSEWRINEIKRLSGQLTLTQWSEYFEIDITAMHHFFTRKRLHHLRKNPPEKYKV